MGYMVIKVYSFECDHPGCRDDAWEVIAPSLREAVKELRRMGWVTGNGEYRCPEHGKEVMSHDHVAASEHKPARPDRVTARSRVTLELGSA